MRVPEIMVLSKGFKPLGPINKATALRWVDRVYDYGIFELWCPLISSNLELLQEDNLIWLGGESAGVIEAVQKTKSPDGDLGLHISGRMLECWMGRRVIIDSSIGKLSVSNHMRNLVLNNLTKPKDPRRKIYNVGMYLEQNSYGPIIPCPINQGNLWEALVSMGKAHKLFPKLALNISLELCVFKVIQGTDRSVEQQLVPPVELSSDLSDILTMQYASDLTDYKTTALVAGQGEGADRQKVMVNDTKSGLSRRELWVDARDLAPEGSSEDYLTMLTERGKAKLAEHLKVESFDAQMRLEGTTAYTYNKDYFLGDRVTISDVDLNTRISTEITAFEQTWDVDGYSAFLTLGHSAPTITQLLKKGDV